MFDTLPHNHINYILISIQNVKKKITPTVLHSLIYNLTVHKIHTFTLELC